MITKEELLKSEFSIIGKKEELFEAEIILQKLGYDSDEYWNKGERSKDNIIIKCYPKRQYVFLAIGSYIGSSYTFSEFLEITKEKDYSELKKIHEKIRKILIDNGCEEHGDCIIDDICYAVGILPTTVYYEED
mgnify:CR=1 FL=1